MNELSETNKRFLMGNCIQVAAARCVGSEPISAEAADKFARELYNKIVGEPWPFGGAESSPAAVSEGAESILYGPIATDS